MAVIPVGKLAPTGMWDGNMLELLFSNRLYPTGLQFKPVLGYPNADGCCILIPGKYWAEHTDQISEALATFEWVLAFRYSDEEDWFDIHQVSHPNLRWWVQYPHIGKDYGAARFFGAGITPHFNKLPANPQVKDLDLFLSAQRTHIRRDMAFDALEQVQSDSTLIEQTEGFTRGMVASAYCDAMMRAKVAPAPSGAQTPDSFRLWEALESHTVPIADDISPVYDSTGFWADLLPDAPFPTLTDYKDLPGVINDVLTDWPRSANRAAAYWMRYKRGLAHALREDLEALGAL